MAGRIVGRERCPSCAESGGDRSSDNLVRFEDGGSYCYVCKKSGLRLGENRERELTRLSWDKPRDVALEMKMISNFPCRGHDERGISKTTMERFGVRCEIDEATGEPSAFFYPYHSDDGDVVGYKRRTLPKQFSVIGKLKGLFGQKQCKENAQFLAVFEGEVDALSAWEMLSRLGKTYNVVSIPNGASEEGVLDKSLLREMEWIAKHKKVAICFDMDGPGQATARTLADHLVGQCEVRLMELPFKDANEMLKRGLANEFFRAIGNSKEFRPEQIEIGTDGGLEPLVTPLKSGIMIPFLPKTCKMLRGFRTRELTTWIAPPNVGKTSLFDDLVYYTLVNTEEDVAGFFLEETTTKTKQRVIAAHCNMPLNEYRANPNRADKHLIQEAFEVLLPRLHLFSHRSKMMTDELIERKIEYLVKSVGVKRVFFDHLSYVIGSRAEGDERRGIDNLMTRLSRSVEDWDYMLHMISHIKRGGKERSRSEPQKKYPYWEVLDLSDGRGSGSIEQLSHNLIALEKQVLDPEADNTRGLIRTRLLRAREWGHTGVGDYLTFNQNGRFQAVEVEY